VTEDDKSCSGKWPRKSWKRKCMDNDLRMKLADLGSPEALADRTIDYFPDVAKGAA
jgi:hypothetical protein